MQFLPPISGGVSFLLARSYLGDTSPKKHIPFSRSFSCNRRFGQQKSRHTNVYRLIKRVELPPWCVGFHIHVPALKFKVVLRSFPFPPEAKGSGYGSSIFVSILLRCRLAPSFKICVSQYLVATLRKEYFIIYQQTSVCQYFFGNFLNISRKR